MASHSPPVPRIPAPSGASDYGSLKQVVVKPVDKHLDDGAASQLYSQDMMSPPTEAISLGWDSLDVEDSEMKTRMKEQANGQCDARRAETDESSNILGWGSSSLGEEEPSMTHRCYSINEAEDPDAMQQQCCHPASLPLDLPILLQSSFRFSTLISDSTTM